MDLIDIYRVFHSTTYILSRTETFFRADHALALKAYLRKCERMKIISCILSRHSTMKLEISNKRNHIIMLTDGNIKLYS